MKNMFKKFTTSILFCLFAIVSVYAAEKGTPGEARKMVVK